MIMVGSSGLVLVKEFAKGLQQSGLHRNNHVIACS
jgi:hypothetical protein